MKMDCLRDLCAWQQLEALALRLSRFSRHGGLRAVKPLPGLHSRPYEVPYVAVILSVLRVEESERAWRR